jgi:drug/metabolite transporter (DMT)-like permease
MVEGMTPGDVTILRFGVSGLLFLPITFQAKPPIIGTLGWRRLFALTALAGFPYSLVLVSGVIFAPALHNSVLNQGLMPLIALAIARIVFSERVGWRRLTGIVVAGVGFAIFSFDAIVNAPFREKAWIGDLCFVTTAMMWALFGTLSKHWRIDAVSTSASICVLSLIMLPILALIVPLRLAESSWPAIALQAVYQGVIVSAVSLILYIRTVNLIGPVNAALMLPLVPIVTMLCDAFAGDEPTRLEIIGALIVTASMILTLRSDSAKGRSKDSANQRGGGNQDVPGHRGTYR